MGYPYPYPLSLFSADVIPPPPPPTQDKPRTLALHCIEKKYLANAPWWGQKGCANAPRYSKKKEGQFFESKLIQKLFEGKLLVCQ